MMFRKTSEKWKDKVVLPDKVLEKIEPGMSIFLSTSVAEPRTLVKRLMAADMNNLQDLELIQLVSLGDALSIEVLHHQKYRLKTFFSGYLASEAITAGLVDLIPSRFSRIPRLFKTGAIRLDMAFIQTTPPDENGYCSLGVVTDAARQAMECAAYVVAEINEEIPRTLGDTLVHVDEFDALIESTEPPIYFDRWPVDDVFDKVASNAAQLIEDGSCISYSIGPLFEALSTHLSGKRDLGIHSAFITDALMNLIMSGAVTNRRKATFRGKSLASYALGTRELFRWLDQNPLVEFQGIDVTADPESMGRNDHFIAILPARKVDLTGDIALHFGKGNIAAGPGEAYELFTGASLSHGGRSIIALPSRNLAGKPNILISIDGYPNQVPNRELIDVIVTEYGVAYLNGRTVRERAQALIDIAHPDDRAELVREAKEANILYRDQIYLVESGKLYPEEIACTHVFKGGLQVHFRAIKPSDEEEMRRLFYRFSDKAVYYRYFSPIQVMPHGKMQEYVNVDYRRFLSIVGTIGETEKIIAEARCVRARAGQFADIAFVTDEEYQGHGIATFLFLYLIKLARERGIKGFTADVLATNKEMMKVFEKSPFTIEAKVNSGIYELVIPFTETNPQPKDRRIVFTQD